MKKIFAIIVSSVLGAFFGIIFTSCDDDGSNEMEWDFASVGIKIMIVDEEGTNLLNPTVEGNWMEGDFVAYYNDETYFPTWKNTVLTDKSRSYMPHFYGLECLSLKIWDGGQWVVVPNEYYLYFGEFDGSRGQNIKMKLGLESMNGFIDIELKHTVRWEKGTPKVENIYTVCELSNVSVEDGTIYVAIPRREQMNSSEH